MRALVERVDSAKVNVGKDTIAKIDKGLLVYIGIAQNDNEQDIEYIINKIVKLRIFEDREGKMNLDITQVAGQLLIIPAFTLQADTRKGNRPSFDQAAKPEYAKKLFEKLTKQLNQTHIPIQTGKFAEHMHIEAINNGPICILLDSKKLL